MASRRGSQGHHQLPVANVEVRGRFVEQDDGGVLGEQDDLYRLLDEILQTGVPLEFDRNGRRLRIIAEQPVGQHWRASGGCRRQFPLVDP